MWYIVLLGLLAVANGSYLAKRAMVTMDAGAMAPFTEQFHTTLMHIIATHWNETAVLGERLLAEKQICENKMLERQTECENCMRDTCSTTPNAGQGIAIANEIKNLFDDAGHGFVSWEGWHEMGNFFEGVGNKYLGWEGFRDMSDFFSDISRGFTRWSGWKKMVKLFEKFGEGFLDFGEDLHSGLSGIGKGIGSSFSSFGKGIGSGISSFGSSVSSGFKKLGGFLGLGRRKRSYSSFPLSSVRRPNPPTDVDRRQIENPEIRQCAERCTSCAAFLKTTPEAIVGDICGRDYVEMNRTVQMVVHKLELLYNRMVMEEKLAVTGLVYDSTSVVGFELQKVVLTGFFENGVRDYETKVPYNLMSVPKSAALMAKEYFDLFMETP